LKVPRGGHLLGGEHAEEDRNDLVGRVIVTGLEVVLVLLLERLPVTIEARSATGSAVGGKSAGDSLVEVEVELHDLVLDELHDEVGVTSLTLTDWRVDVDLLSERSAR
jgi:hypothetical protein